MAAGSRRRRSRTSGRTIPLQDFTLGIDVSHHQGTIDWAKVAAKGITYCFVKATEGAAFKDPRFAANWKGTADAGIIRGAYHFFAPQMDVDRQFANFKGTVALSPGDLAPVLDLETDGQNWNALPPDKRLAACMRLLELLQDHYGVTPLVYTNKRTVAEIFGGKPGDLAKYPLWVASYKASPPPTMPAGWTDWKHWQHTDAGRVEGIAGPVDLNRCIGEPGPVVLAPAPSAATVPRAIRFSAAATGELPATAADDPLVAFTRIWGRVCDDAASLFPDGVGSADVRVDVEPSGRSVVAIHLAGRVTSFPEVAPQEKTFHDTRAKPFGFRLAVPPIAIDLTKPLSQKVPAFWEILEMVVADLDASAPVAQRRIVKRFLMHLAAHESQLRTRKQDAGGPARSLFQFEAHRAKDAGVHAQTLKLLDKLASASANTVADIKAAITALPAFDPQNPGGSAKFPPNNIIEARFLDNDLFSAYMVRIDFRRFAAPIPESNADQAEYWLKFWKVSASNPAQLKKQFLANCATVDPHIPA